MWLSCMKYLAVMAFLANLVSSQEGCDFCLGLAQPVCNTTTGCFWSNTRRTCGNNCEYSTEETCGVENENDPTGLSNQGCWRVCRWLPGGLSACIIKWDFHFDVCMAVDASESITDPEWATIRLFFIEEFINAITPPACDIFNSETSRFCPHASIVQFDSIAQVIIPNLTSIKPWYTEQSYCFTDDTILKHLQPGWQDVVRGMRSSLQQRADGTRQAGGNTWTLEAVQRCADLLLNTHRAEPKALSLFILMTDGSPNGPNRCEGDVCAICEENPQKKDQFIARRRTDPGCNPAVSGQTFSETRQNLKMDESSTRRLFVYFKTDVTGAFKSFAKLDCLLERGTIRFFEPIRVQERLLQNPNDPGTRAEIGGILKVLSDTVCDFSDAPTMSPTSEPTGTPTRGPTASPSVSPTRSPSTSPTICVGPPPDFPSASNVCDGACSGFLTVINDPVISVDLAKSETKLCYTYILSGGSNCPSIGSVTRMSLAIDECCPDGQMAYLEGVQVIGGSAVSPSESSVSYTANECGLTGEFYEIGMSELSGGIMFGAMTDGTDIYIKLRGPDNAWVGVGFNSAMVNTDAIMYSTGTSGSDALGIRDYYLSARNPSGVNADAQQDYEVLQFSSSSGVFEVVVRRKMDTGDALDYVFVAGASTIPLVWAWGDRSTRLAYHGMTRRGIGTRTFARAMDANPLRRFLGFATNNMAVGCSRVQRACSTTGNTGAQCSVLSVKNLNVTDARGQFCVSVAGVGYDTAPNDGVIDNTEKSKICVERVNPSGGRAYCSCTEVSYLNSRVMCDNTRNPTYSPTASPSVSPSKSPSSSPTGSPTTCKGPPPNFPNPAGDRCQDNCDGLITVGRSPSVSVDAQASTTTICWAYEFVTSDFCSNAGAMTRASFVMDECCPDGQMDFVEGVALTSGSGADDSFTRNECVVSGPLGRDPFSENCNRFRRFCSSAGNTADFCTVVNMNNLARSQSSGEYCLTMAGVSWDVAPIDNKIDDGKVETAKICFERESPGVGPNYCTCLEVDFITSRDICGDTANPTTSPSDSPTKSPTSSPSGSPTNSPSVSPTKSPSTSPSKSPSASPTDSPSDSPTGTPSGSPTRSPSASPTQSPTGSPSLSPSKSPTGSPTTPPSESPTKSPTGSPSLSPSESPTKSPSTSPSKSPSSSPTLSPTNSPTTCVGPPPNFPGPGAACRDDCVGMVTVSSTPSLDVDMTASTTTVCYDYQLSEGSNCANAGDVRRASFVIDECCPDGQMEFVEGVSMNGQSFGRDECALVGPSGNAFLNNCNRFQRNCASTGNEASLCTVVNLNNVNDGANSGKFCVVIAGTSWDVQPGPNGDGAIDDGKSDTSKICFERVSPSGPQYCECVEVEFISSRDICGDTRNPTKSPSSSPTQSPSDGPTSSPTQSPTTCRGPPPDFVRRDCSSLECKGQEAVVNVQAEPIALVNADDTTTICWEFSSTNGGGDCNPNGNGISGLSFMMDECCPDGRMEFIEEVEFGRSNPMVYPRNTCPVARAGTAGARRNGCVRVTRKCSSFQRTGEDCTVVSLNGLSSNESPNEFCVTIPGTNWVQPGTTRLLDGPQNKQAAKICFERGDSSPASQSVCSCMEVNFINSVQLCDGTGSPSGSPTKNPSTSPSKSPTKSPSASPTGSPTISPSGSPSASPTQSPTVCSGPPPPFSRPNCKSEECSGGNGIVDVNMEPRVLSNADDTTTVCWSYTLASPGGACDPQGKSVRGVSFMMDECCPDGKMEFVEEVEFGTSNPQSFSRSQCQVVSANSPAAKNNNCVRATRKCSSFARTSADCTVVSLNNLDSSESPNEFCLTIPGSNWENPGTNRLRDDGDRKQLSQLCFERGDASPANQNICTCVEVYFINSYELCDQSGIPTKSPTQSPSASPSDSPTKSPTSSPTRSPNVAPSSSPTVCSGPPPDDDRPNCKDEECGGGNGVVNVDPKPRLQVNAADETTTICWSYTLNEPSGACAANGKNVRGISFMMDECCPDGLMDFVEQVRAGSSSYARRECDVLALDSAEARSKECVRGQRLCSSAGQGNEMCSVVSLNKLDVGASQYCLTIAGTNFNVPGTNDLKTGADNQQKAKICFERGDESPAQPSNVCTCVEVDFVNSKKICQKTGAPSTSPTSSPTICSGPPPPFKRKDCSDAECMMVNGVVDVDPNPALSVNNMEETTTICWSYTLRSPPGACAPSNKPVRGVSFMMDECCPDGQMDFVEEVSLGRANQKVSYGRRDCAVVSSDSAAASSNECVRGQRRCSSSGNSNEMCSVVSLNGQSNGQARGQYCLKIAGTNFKAVGSDQLSDEDGNKQKAQMCFERGDASPAQASNVCTCQEVYFVDSKKICQKTGVPSKSPTKSPTTQSPTGCQGPPSDFTREKAKDCSLTECSGLDSNVRVASEPTMTIDGDASNTKFCWNFDVQTPRKPECQPSSTTIRGVSFMIDECCPVAEMEFLQEVSFGDVDYNVKGGECPKIDGEFGPAGCVRAQRDCSSPTSAGKKCSVVNINDIEFDGSSGSFCVVVPGVAWNKNNPNRIDSGKREVGKICFENGGASFGSENICSCVEVAIPKSNLLCQVTPSPTKAPSKQPSKAPTSGECVKAIPEEPQDRSCTNRCGENEVTEWTVAPGLMSTTYFANGDYTLFEYCVEYDAEWYKQPNACIANGKTRPSAVSNVVFRLDECCDLCLKRDHFYRTWPRLTDIKNPSGGSSYFKLERGSKMTTRSPDSEDDDDDDSKSTTRKPSGKVTTKRPRSTQAGEKGGSDKSGYGSKPSTTGKPRSSKMTTRRPHKSTTKSGSVKSGYGSKSTTRKPARKVTTQRPRTTKSVDGDDDEDEDDHGKTGYGFGGKRGYRRLIYGRGGSYPVGKSTTQSPKSSKTYGGGDDDDDDDDSDEDEDGGKKVGASTTSKPRSTKAGSRSKTTPYPKTTRKARSTTESRDDDDEGKNGGVSPTGKPRSTKSGVSKGMSTTRRPTKGGISKKYGGSSTTVAPGPRRECFVVKVNGRVGTSKGLMCINGGSKCKCSEMDVPSSCDLKKIFDPSCVGTPSKGTTRRPGGTTKSGGNGGSNDGDGDGGESEDEGDEEESDKSGTKRTSTTSLPGGKTYKSTTKSGKGSVEGGNDGGYSGEGGSRNGGGDHDDDEDGDGANSGGNDGSGKSSSKSTTKRPYKKRSKNPYGF